MKGKWSLRRSQDFHSTLSVLSTLRHHSTLALQLWYNLHSYIFAKGRERKVINGLCWLRFWRFMPKGERVLAQSKRTAPPPNFKKSFSIGMIFQIGISLCSKGGESNIFKISILKPSWTLRGGIYQGGVLFSQRKSIWNRGENFKSWKCFSKSYSYTFDYLQKTLKRFSKKICKNKTCGANVVQNVK